MPLIIVRNDITKMSVDAIVNAAKESLQMCIRDRLPPCSRPPIRYPADIRCGLYAEPHKGQTRDELDDILTAAAVLRAEEITMTCVTAPDDPHARDRAIDRVCLLYTSASRSATNASTTFR